MKNNPVLNMLRITSLLRTGLTSSPYAMADWPTAAGKCVGIAAQGKNNGGIFDASHSCAEQAS
ncbi:MAG: putative membrane protein [Methylophagaceae bacterium]|jgi:uncharacterized membrane protein